jgi:hypothetical protein
LVEQLVLCNEVPSALDQDPEQIEGARPHRDRLAIAEQPTLIELQLESSKAVALG